MSRTLAGLPEDIPARSDLYRLPPVGVGTTAVEGLTSYVMRLSAAHHLTPGVLLGTVFRQSIVGPRTGNVRTAVQMLAHAQAANGLTGEAAMWSAAVAAATKLVGLEVLTLLGWRDVLPIRHVLRDRIAYCPQCLTGFAAAGVVYEPLIWSLRRVTVCPIHRKTLRTMCGSCGATQRAMRFRSLVGTCRDCAQWLGDDAPGDAGTYYEFETSLVVADLVLGRRQLPLRSVMPSLIADATNRLGLSAEQYAEAAGVSAPEMSDWARGRGLPSIDAVIRLCYVGGWAPRAFLEGRLLSSDALSSARVAEPRSVAPAVRTSRRRATDWPKVFAQIKARLDEPAAPPSLLELASACDVAPKWLSRKLPADLRTEVKDRHAKWRADGASARLASAIAEIERICFEEIAKGNRASRRDVEALLSGTNSLREPILMRAWQAATRERRTAGSRRDQFRQDRYDRG